MQAQRQGDGREGGGAIAPPYGFELFFWLVSSVTYGDDDNTPTPLWFKKLPQKFSVETNVFPPPFPLPPLTFKAKKNNIYIFMLKIQNCVTNTILGYSITIC